MTAHPQSPALTPAIEALVEKAHDVCKTDPARPLINILHKLALAVAEAAAREATERACKATCSDCWHGREVSYSRNSGYHHRRPGEDQRRVFQCSAYRIRDAAAKDARDAIRGGADAESE